MDLITIAALVALAIVVYAIACRIGIEWRMHRKDNSYDFDLWEDDDGQN